MKRNPLVIADFLQQQQAKHLYRKPRITTSAQQGPTLYNFTADFCKDRQLNIRRTAALQQRRLGKVATDHRTQGQRP